MIKVSSFDYVHDVQSAFRKILVGYSFPMTIQNLQAEMAKLEEPWPNLLLPSLVLIDQKVGVKVMGNGDLLRLISERTHCRQEEDRPNFLLVPLDTPDRDPKRILDQAYAGSLASPHLSTTIIVEVDAIDGEDKAVFTGPGIKGEKQVVISREMVEIIRERDQRDYEYPTGVDLIFVDQKGLLVTLSRKIKMQEVQ